MRERSLRPRQGQAAQRGACDQGGDARESPEQDLSDCDPHAEHACAGRAGRARRHGQRRTAQGRNHSDVRLPRARPSGARRTARDSRHSARHESRRSGLLLLERERCNARAVALLLGAARAGRTRIHDVHDALRGERADAFRDRLSAVLRRSDLQSEKRGSRAYRDLRADAGRLPRRRRARRGGSAALLHGVHAVLPHGGWQLRQGVARDFPRTPVPQGRADRLLQAGGFGEVP